MLCLLFMAYPFATSWAAPTLPSIFSDHMVLQQGRPIPVWGWASPGEKVTVGLGDGARVTATADASGRWRVHLDPHPAGGPYRLHVQGGDSSVAIEDVYVGEVWLCAGQSNMEMKVHQTQNAGQEISEGNWPMIRHLNVPRKLSNEPQDDQDGMWVVCSPDTVGGFTAVGYYFAHRLHQSLDVPVGLLNASWGGTRIEPWISPEGLAAVPSLRGLSDDAAVRRPSEPLYQQNLNNYLQEQEQWLSQARRALDQGERVSPPPTFPSQTMPYIDRQDPTVLHNGMIAPLMPYEIRGVIWYQGEANRLDHDYLDKTRALIDGWRRVWREDLPYYFVQIAPFHYRTLNPEILPRFWMQQAEIEKSLPGASMVVIHDVADTQDIHPKQKRAVGERLADQALKLTYNQDVPVYKGPRFHEMQVEGNTLSLQFDHVGSGLASRNGQPLDGFELIGPGSSWVQAYAEIVGEDTVAVSAEGVISPSAVRFAWHKMAQPNLMNREGLPAAPFTAGHVPDDDPLRVSIPEASEYQLVYDLDLSKLGKQPTYDRDLSDQVAGSLDRVAYYMQLQADDEPMRWVFVSMDAFTDDVSKLAIPTLSSGAMFQMNVSHMNIWSNDEQLKTGVGIDRGHIEFWPNNYGPKSSPNSPIASDQLRDHGDTPNPSIPDGYGSMQVHWPQEQQTVFAINHWAARSPDIGIGNAPEGQPDWSFSANAQTYQVKRLRIYVKVSPNPRSD